MGDNVRRNGHGVGLSNSFTLAEIKAFLELHACLLRGGDGRTIARSAAMTKLAQKFGGMRRKHERELALADVPVTQP
jgi:hypothetical protein